MKLVYHGPLGEGTTSIQRALAFAQIPSVDLLQLDTTRESRSVPSIYERLRWKIGWPIDTLGENERLVAMCRWQKPDVLLVDNSKVLRRAVLRSIRDRGVLLIYYTPDDAMAQHNIKRPLRRSFDLWDVFFTTKTYNVKELRACGVRNPVLIGNSFHPEVHHEVTPAEAGKEFEAFDLVFIGALERERCVSISRLAEAGMTVLVHGASTGALVTTWSTKPHPNITLREPVYGQDYSRCAHHAKIALCFLRKANRDRITQRSIELPAMTRPMLAEKTDEHDAHFIDGAEYVGFGDDDDLVQKARALLANPDRRRRIAEAGRRRCLSSGYSTLDRATQMMEIIRSKLVQRYVEGQLQSVMLG
jgi:spore maturation protein CgeB